MLQGGDKMLKMVLAAASRLLPGGGNAAAERRRNGEPGAGDDLQAPEQPLGSAV